MSLARWRRRMFKRIGFGPAEKARPPDPALDPRRIARLAADDARNTGEWNEAARLYAVALDGDEGNFPIQVQHAHALKESGRLTEAETAYRTAIALRRDDPDTYLHLGHVLKLQRRPEDALEAYADALRWNPDFKDARDELIAAGGRGRLPHQAFGRNAVTDRLSELAVSLKAVQQATSEWLTAGVFPVEAWDAFRRAYRLQPPPAADYPATVTVVVDARSAPPSALRVTLNSLRDQRQGRWRAWVRCDDHMAAHPIASLAARDERIIFLGSEADSTFADRLPGLSEAEGPLVLADAGLCLERDALSWLLHALNRSEATAVHADHDHHEFHWRRGAIYRDPALYSAPDADDIATTPVVPALVMVNASLGAVVLETSATGGSEQRRQLLLTALEQGVVAHVPRVLATLRIQAAASDLPGEAQARQVHASTQRIPKLEGRMLVVIPTRDEAAMLRTCIDSLIRHASDPGKLDILVLDNRSREPETIALLETLSAEGRIQCRSMNEAFNWGRFNNLAVEGSEAEILVFSNNDVEALSPGWDDALRLRLARPDIGVVGARLFYPDRTLQHAGVVLGGGEGRPIHEGLHSAPGEGGPLGRWRRGRSAAAVTGAFMAVRRSTFVDLDGFDENLAVGYNDMDLCLKVRAADMKVFYAPEIELIHHESKTRGFNDGGERTLWDDSELADLHRKWGDWLFFDPSLNPQWTSAHSRVFDGYRDLSPRQVDLWIDRTARRSPWSIDDDDTDLRM